MPPDEYAALRQSIREHGQCEPKHVAQDGGGDDLALIGCESGLLLQQLQHRILPTASFLLSTRTIVVG
jgi:hypothetical protein